MQDIIYFINQNLLLSSSWLVIVILLILLEIKVKFFGPKQLSTAELVQWINHSDAIMYDIRPKIDYDSGHISQALSAQDADLKLTDAQMARPIIIVCKDGVRSSQQAFKLKNKSQNEIGYLKGGLLSWQAEGLPIVKDNQ